MNSGATSSRLGIAAAAAAIALSAGGAAPGAQQKPATKPSVAVYKSATCGCCSGWVAHMRKNGFDVKAVDVDDIEVPKKTYGVPPAASSCHTALVGGYVIEGHVPADAVTRLLRERPNVAGLAVRGMPIGTPGMEMGGQKDPYVIASFDKTGRTAVYERR
jgi:hypothetical protein